MKLRVLMLALPIVAPALVACGGGEPVPPCLVGRGTYLARYFPKDANDACAQSQQASLGHIDIWAVQKYNALHTTQQDVVMKPGYILTNSNATTTDVLMRGAFGTQEPVNKVCAADTWTPASSGGVSFAPSNVKFYVTPAVPGTQAKGDIKINDGTCEADYTFVMIYPVTTCQVFDPDTGDPIPGTFDDSVCPSATAKGKADPNGAALNPDFVTECDHTTGFCEVPAADPFPSVKAGKG